jgi:transcriptional regulator with XRE-family HTH domain
MRFGELMRQERLKRGWTQAELCSVANCNRAVGAQIEIGKRHAYLNTCLKICTALEIPIEQMLSVSDADDEFKNLAHVLTIGKVNEGDEFKINGSFLLSILKFTEECSQDEQSQLKECIDFIRYKRTLKGGM